jgi:hypothetical protein
VVHKVSSGLEKVEVTVTGTVMCYCPESGRGFQLLIAFSCFALYASFRPVVKRTGIDCIILQVCSRNKNKEKFERFEVFVGVSYGM